MLQSFFALCCAFASVLSSNGLRRLPLCLHGGAAGPLGDRLLVRAVVIRVVLLIHFAEDVALPLAQSLHVAFLLGQGLFFLDLYVGFHAWVKRAI